MSSHKWSVVLAAVLLLLVFSPPASAFRFVAWADTKSARSSLSALSDQVVEFNPVFTIYPGDLESSGFTQSGMDKWKDACNGMLTGGSSSNGMFDKTFVVRGNHDSSNLPGWQNYFNMKETANRVGATNYDYMSGNDDAVYSFDYGNSHFVGLDCLGSAYRLTSGQISWLDSDLASAKSRGLTHAFIFFHGPIYCVNSHCSCSNADRREGVCDSGGVIADLIKVLDKHTIVTATFHGHEHLYTYTYLDSSRVPGLANPFHHFVTGDAGAGPKPCDLTKRFEYCMSAHGFITLDVDGPKVIVNWYKQGSSSVQHKITFVKGTGDCTSHSYSACYSGDVYYYDSCGVREEKKEECGSASCENGVCVTQCTSHDNFACYDGDVYYYDSCNNREEKKEECGTSQCENGQCVSGACITGDLNCDTKVDIFDLVLVAQNFGKSDGDPGWNPAADPNNSGKVDIFDLVLVAQNFGKTAP